MLNSVIILNLLYASRDGTYHLNENKPIVNFMLSLSNVNRNPKHEAISNLISPYFNYCMNHRINPFIGIFIFASILFYFIFFHKIVIIKNKKGFFNKLKFYFNNLKTKFDENKYPFGYIRIVISYYFVIISWIVFLVLTIISQYAFINKIGGFIFP
jgi:hypothetical protein